MRSFRFLHAADIHLDSPLRGLAGIQGRTAERIRTAPRRAFQQLIERAISQEVDFLIIAGDLYDGTWRDYKTGLFFAEQMGRLNQAHIPVFLLYGNHDAESQITNPLVLPDNVKVFGSRKAETFRMEELQVALHGQSFRQRDVTDNLVPGYPLPIDGAFNIGVLHTALGGMGDHANYAPCSLPELVAKGYAYWALGHVHQRQVLHERPHVVFPGNLQGRHARETGAKGAYMVTVEAGEIGDLTALDLDVVRWSTLDVDVTSASTFGAVVDLIRDTIVQAADDATTRQLLACRIRLTGRSGIHDRLVAEAETLHAEARSASLGLGEEIAWVERVVIETTPMADPATLAARQDTLGDLQRMLREAGSDGALLKQLETDIGELVRRAPHDLRQDAVDPVLRAAIAGDLAGLIEQVTPYLNSRLTVQDG